MKDINGKKPEEDGYDPTTLHVPKKDYEKMGPLIR